MLIREGEQTFVSEVSSDKETPVINHWLNNCENNHADFASSESDFMPIRILDIGGAENQEPRLVLKADLGYLNTTAHRYMVLKPLLGI